jgi:hypothetical protein
MYTTALVVDDEPHIRRALGNVGTRSRWSPRVGAPPKLALQLARCTVTRQGCPESGDRWVAFVERAAPWIVGALLVGIAALWLLAGILEASWARF